MDKKTFMDAANYEDKVVLSSIYDKLALSERINSQVFTSEFYPPGLWKSLEAIQGRLPVNVHSFGVFEEAERRLVAFSQYEIQEYPVKLVEIRNDSKFNKLQHGDFLGALMSLGLKREKFGDLLVKDDKCHVAVHEEIADYILMNLRTIGKAPVEALLVDHHEFSNLEPEFQTLVVNVSSTRCDAMVSAICNISRSKAEDLIKRGNVLVDYEKVQEKSEFVKADTVVTVRGHGKFKIQEAVGHTSRGKNKIRIKKYI